MDKQGLFFYFIIFLTGFVFSFFPIMGEEMGQARYLVLLALPFMILVLTGFRSNPFNSRKSAYLKSMLVLNELTTVALLIISFFLHLFNPRSLHEVLYFITPILTASTIWSIYDDKYQDGHLKVFFWFWMAFYLIDISDEIPMFLSKPSLFIEGFSTSYMPTESTAAYTFGLFVIYFVLVKNKKYAILSLIGVCLSFKRIVFAGLLFTYIVSVVGKYSLPQLFRSRKLVTFALFGASFVWILIVVNLIEGTFDEFIANLLGQSPNEILLGRVAFYGGLLKEYGTFTSWFGIGIGGTSNFLRSNAYNFLNLHSDILKMYSEWGVVIFCAYTFLFYYASSYSRNMILVVSYLFVLFLTDNCFIYFDVMLIFYLVQSEFSKRSSEKAHMAFSQELKEGVVYV